MPKRDTHPAHIFGYAIIIYWITDYLVFSLLGFMHFGQSFLFEQSLSAIFDVFYIYIAILALFIGGGIWFATRILSQMSNHMRAIICGGAVGVTLFAIRTYAISNFLSTMSLYRPFLLIPICLLSASLGERLARRHVKINPKTVSKTFE